MIVDCANVGSGHSDIARDSSSRSVLHVPASVADYLRANPSYLSDAQVRMHSDLTEAYFVERAWRKDWLALSSHLPDRPRSILDIGGGVGAIALLIHRFANGPDITLVEQKKRHVQGWDFDVLRLAGEFFAANGVPSRSVSFVDASEEPLSLIERGTYDLIVSLRALAFVFPYERYRAALRKSLRPGGTMILDIKKKGSGFQKSFDACIRDRFAGSDPRHYEVVRQLQEDFGSAIVLGDYENSVRVLVRSRPA